MTPGDIDRKLPIWRIISASVPGIRPKKTEQLCQDAHYWGILPGGVLVAAVADGAGSAALGEVGASIAVHKAVEVICSHQAVTELSKDEQAWIILLSNALESAKAAVEVEATARQVKVRELATTLILVVATPEIAVAAQVGDGAAIVGDDQGNIVGLTTPQSGVYVNETTFIISPGGVETAQLKVWHGVTENIAIFSDGLQRLALNFPEGMPHAPFISLLFRFVREATDEVEAKEQLAKFLVSPSVTDETDDDLTLFLAALVR